MNRENEAARESGHPRAGKSIIEAESRSDYNSLIFPLKEHPEWRRDPRAVTLLRATPARGRARYATKRWIPGEEKPRRADDVKRWNPLVALATDIQGLSAVLSEAASDPRIELIRGAVKEQSAAEASVNRRVNEDPKQPDAPDIEDCPRHPIGIDIDDAPEPDDFAWLDDPRRAAIWAADRYTPAPFHGCAFHYEYSSSAGYPGKKGLRLHLWYWLEQPADSKALKEYFDTFKGTPLDLSLYNAVQPHYIAAPIIPATMADPLEGRRRGLVLDGRSLTVKLALRPRVEVERDAPPADLRVYNDLPLADVRGALDALGTDLDRTEWFRYSTAVKHHLITALKQTEQEAYAFCDAWWKTLPGYNEPENQRQWSTMRIDLPLGSQVTIGTLIRAAGEKGWKPSSDDRAILTGMDDSRTISKQVWDRILEQEGERQTLFRYGRQIARLDADIEVLTKDSFWQLLAARLDFCRMAGKRRVPCDPPQSLITYILNTPPRDIPLPELMGLTRTPVMAGDGSVHLEAGYSPVSKLFHFPSVEVGDIPERPNAAQVAAARDLLEEVICDFPFLHQSDRAHALSLLLLPFVRPMIAGPTPIYLINKPTQGTGATLLGEIATLIKTGEPLTAANAPKTEEEWQKTIVAKLLLFPDFFFIDNITRIKSEALATALTATAYEGRRLGVSEMVRVPVRCTWIMTGNNPELSADFPRRVVQIRLDANMDDPSQGRTFRHENLKEWISGERGRIVAAILTLARAWIAAGKPRPTTTLASFEDWAAVVGGILGNAGLEGFLLTPEDRKHFDDPWQAVEREFVSCWLAHAVRDWQQFRKVKSRMLFNLAERCELQIGGGLRGHEHGQLTQFGMKLARLRDKTFTVRATDFLPNERIPEVKVKVVRVGQDGDAWWCLDADEQQFAGLHFSSFWSGPVWD